MPSMRATAITREGFLKGALASMGLGFLGGGRLLAAPDGWKPGGKPNLVFGVVSDTHMRTHYDGVNFYSHYETVMGDYGYNVVVAGAEKKLKKSVYANGYSFGEGHEPDSGVTTVSFPKADLPPDDWLAIAVRPCSSLATRGKAIAVKFSVRSGLSRKMK